jgi:hypothetical protein
VTGDDVGVRIAVAPGMDPLVEAIEGVVGSMALGKLADKGCLVVRAAKHCGPRAKAVFLCVESATGPTLSHLGVRSAVVDDPGVDAEATGKQRRPRGQTGNVRGVVVREPSSPVGDPVDVR